MKIFMHFLRFLFITFLLFLAALIFKQPHKDLYGLQDTYIYSKGNAPDSIRQEILENLNLFQDGYINRDYSELQNFMDQLFSKENVLILGTMPNEIYAGYDEATSLVRSDWESWGDCTFFMEEANISIYNGVVWFSTIGHVVFDLTSLLDLPLRLTGLLVNEDNSWKIQQLQFQFDLDLTIQLLLIFLLAVWLFISFIGLIILLFRSIRQINKSSYYNN
ncbi:nuclear transport factor 2 family protein [Bacteroidota bacterium]